MEKIKQNILAIAITLGFLFLGYFIYKGLKTFSDKDRYVTVKGLAEMDIEATAAQVNINFSYSGDQLNDVIKRVEEKNEKIKSYLQNSGYNTTKIVEKNIQIIDKLVYFEDEWVDGKQVKVKIDRYVVSKSIQILETNIQETKNIADKINLDLIHSDMTSTVSTNYTFPDLNTIKPQLIAESTQNARIAGEQFANDSNAKLGKIKTASQGQISLAGTYNYDEDASNSQPTSEYIQRARVVSTIVFFLE